MARDLFASESKYAQHGIGDQAQEQGGGILHSMANSTPVQATLGAGDAIRNMLSLGMLSNSQSSNFGTTEGPNSGQGAAYNIGKIGGDVAGFIGGGELMDTARAALAAKNLGALSSAAGALGGQGAAGAARRIIGSSIGGAAVNPDDRLGGAVSGGLMGGVGEAIPYAVKSLKHVAEFINPQEYTNKLVENINKVYDQSRELASSYYDPILKKFGNYHINKGNPSREYMNTDPNLIKNYYSPDLEIMHKEFMAKPTFERAHDLQSQIGLEIGALKGNEGDAINRNTIQSLRQAREALKTDMDSFLRQRNPKMADNYKTGAEIFRTDVAPFRSNETIANISKGSKQTIEPLQLQSILKNLSEKGALSTTTGVGENAITKNHYLQGILDNLAPKINRGQAASNIGSMVAGLAGGSFLGGPVGGIAGTVAGKFLGPSMMNLATNPEVKRAISSLEKPYYGAMRAVIANKLQGT